jgi:hypothetical protein
VPQNACNSSDFLVVQTTFADRTTPAPSLAPPTRHRFADRIAYLTGLHIDWLAWQQTRQGCATHVTPVALDRFYSLFICGRLLAFADWLANWLPLFGLHGLIGGRYGIGMILAVSQKQLPRMVVPPCTLLSGPFLRLLAW